MRRFLEFVLLVGGRMVKHSRRLVLRIAASAEPLWSRLIGRIEGWKLAPPKAVGFFRLHNAIEPHPPGRSAPSVTAPIATNNDFGGGGHCARTVKIRYEITLHLAQTRIETDLVQLSILGE